MAIIGEAHPGTETLNAAAMDHRPGAGIRLVFGAAIFLSAFLLFQVQLLLGKFLLPWFGGTSAVWTTCMLFYQVLLLAGYAYAHGTSARLAFRSQVLLHLVLLATSGLLLVIAFHDWGSPILPDATWKPGPSANPIRGILALLTVTVGLPLLALSSTSPLLQRWFARVQGREEAARRPPYYLYALSNFGSLLGLLSYPTAMEPFLELKAQSLLWSAGFAIFVLCCGACAAAVWKLPAATPVASAEADGKSVPASRRWMWLALPACASLFMLSTTNMLTQDIAPVPLLWVMPLAVYLLSFMIVFHDERWYKRGVWHALFLLSAVLGIAGLFRGTESPILGQILTLLLLLFAACMVCHGELARLKPSVRHLTGYYLTISAGGALGALFVSVFAPLVFPALWEFHLGLFATAALLLGVLCQDKEPWFFSGGPQWIRKRDYRWGRATAAAAMSMIGLSLLWHINKPDGKILERSRNFYGYLSVEDKTLPPDGVAYRKLQHGSTLHGLQYLEPALQRQPTSYYVPDGGAGLAILYSPQRSRGPMRVGAIGLGVGTVAAYARPGDAYRFYEINPEMIRVAENSRYFTFLSGARGKIEMVLGDARLSLEAELGRGEMQKFDVLIVDAFNGDAIPVHLLTFEAMQLYRKHLAGPDAIIAVHVSNRSVDLKPVAAALAAKLGMNAALVKSDGVPPARYPSHWIIMTAGDALANPGVRRRVAMLDLENVMQRNPPLWTDDHSSIFRLMAW